MPSKSEAFSLFLFTESNLHCGSGATLSDIDLPIQREVHTQHPIVPGSGLKGALRDLARDAQGKLSPPYEALFGPASDHASDHGGIAIIGESRPILFPVAASGGVYRWITSPMVISRLIRDLLNHQGALSWQASAAASELAAIPIPAIDEFSTLASDRARLYLRDFDLTPIQDASSQSLGEWFAKYALPANSYWSRRAPKNIIVAGEGIFTHMVRFATQIDFHVNINPENGVVEHGPWATESIPADTLLWTCIDLPEPLDGRAARKLKSADGTIVSPGALLRPLVSDRRFQLGGGKSTGLGWIFSRELGA